MPPVVAILDFEQADRELLAHGLSERDYDVVSAMDVKGFHEKIGTRTPNVIITELNLPDCDGMELISNMKARWPEAEIIVLTGSGTFDSAVEATKRGAFHFQAKPHNDGIFHLVERALERRKQAQENVRLIGALNCMNGDSLPIFQSQQMKSVMKTIERVAPSDVSVLITGESGTGKEVVADLIHKLSRRDSGPFIKINCAALPRELIESELFGSVRGSFTGAIEDRRGLFRQAEGGSLLLDELSEMPIDTQSKLLRVLQEREVRPVGGRTSFKTDCRIIAATNQNPENAIKTGKLRLDLYYRISAIRVHLPPLHERPDDILPLARSFLKRFATQANSAITDFTQEACERLSRYNWPGNVRQLQNEIQRAVIMCEGQVVEHTDLSISEMAGSTSDSSIANLTPMEVIERNKIVEVLRETGGNKLEAAKRLGIGRQTLYNKLKAYECSHLAMTQ